MREGMKAGIVEPRVLMEKVLPQLDANAVDDVEKSIFWGPVTDMPADFSAADRERLTTAFRNADQHAAQLPRIASCAPSSPTNTCRRRARPSAGARCRAAPPGTSTDGARQHHAHADAAQVHQIGLDEVARIQDGMRAVAKDLGYTKPIKTLPELKAFFEWMKARDDMYFKSREELLAAYQAFGAERRAAAAEVFQPAAEDRLRSAAGRAVPRSVGVVGPVPGAVARRQACRHLLRECVRPEGAAALGARVAVAARGGAGPSLPDLAAARA